MDVVILLYDVALLIIALSDVEKNRCGDFWRRH